MTPDIRQLRMRTDATPAVAESLTDCWTTVTNTGGAVGFPFPPVARDTVQDRVTELLGTLAADTARVLVAYGAAGDLLGWLLVTRSDFPLVAHWGEVRHVQSHPDVRGRGVGSALMHEARRVARDEMGLEQLRIAVRDGLGLDTFYGRLGWRVVGRWPGALRLGPADDRDEVLMLLDPL